jgi:hypothetical protein
MKTRAAITILFLGAIVILVSAIIFQPSTDITVGPHDGTMKRTGSYYIEMKNGYSGFYTFLFDKKRKPVDNTEIACRVKFEFWDETTLNLQLKPYGKDGFSTESPAPEFYSCKIYFNVSGKQVSAEFENESLLAKKDE